MKEFVDNNYGRRKAEFFRDQVVSNAKAAMIKTRDEAINNPEIFADTPMALNGTQVYNGMKSGDILAMYDKKQNAYNSINPFNGLAQSFTDMTKYFNDPKYFAHKQEFYINDDYAKGLSEDDITNAFMRKGIGSDMAKTVAYDYFNPQQTDTTNISNMSRDDIKAMRQQERDNYRQMKQDKKDWFGSATYIGGYAPSYACGGVKKMAPGGPTVVYVDRFGNKYMSDGSVLKRDKNYYGQYILRNNGQKWSTDKLNEMINSDKTNGYNYDPLLMNIYKNPRAILNPRNTITNFAYANGPSYNQRIVTNSTVPVEDTSSVPTTDTQVIIDNEQPTESTAPIKTSSATSGDTTSTNQVSTTNQQSNQSQNTDAVSEDNQTGISDVSNDQSAVEKIITSNQVGDGRSFININTPWGQGKVYLDNNNIDVRRNGRRLAIWGRQPGEYVAPVTSNGYTRMEVRYPQQMQTTPYEPQISFPKITRKDVVAPNNFYYGDKALLREENNELNSAINSDNPDRFMRCGGVTKAALGMALIDDEKYDNGNMPNTPIGPVNPVSLEPMMTVDTTPSKEDTAIPETENMKMRNDQADAATGIKNKNDYGYGISNAVWNGLMFAGNFAEKMRNDKNKLASVAARLNNTQDAQVAMRGYDPTVNPTHLGYDADPSRLSQLYTYKCGGRKYALGGVYDLTAKEIDEILNNGGKIEYLW